MDIPAETQKRLLALMEYLPPVVRSYKVASGTLSTYLRQMVKSGEIRKTVPEKRGMPYEIRDKLFKLWLSTHPLRIP